VDYHGVRPQLQAATGQGGSRSEAGGAPGRAPLTDGQTKYAAFVEQELKSERERRVNLDARAQSVVTSSGSFVTLLSVVGGLVSSRSGYKLPSVVGYPLVVTVTGFTFAVLFAIFASFIFKYRLADRGSLQRITRDGWRDSEEVALMNIVTTNVTTISSLRNGNDQKARLLIGAWVSQVVALAALGVSVYLIVITR
jgi:hypothetical protein